MKKNTQCKTITREELVEVLKPYPEYEVSQHQLNVVYPNKYIVTGVDDRITVYTKKDDRPTPIYEQTDTPPEATEVYPEFQDWGSRLCEDFQCQLTVKVFVLSDTTPEIGLEVFITYGNDVEEILIDRLISPSELNTSYIEQLKIEINLLNC